MEATHQAHLPPPLPAALWSRDEAARRLQQEQGHWLTVRDAIVVSVIGCVLFGGALGSYAMTVRQVLASALKVPLLLLGTSLLCFPAFYVVQTVRGARPISLARAASAQALGLAAIAVVWGGFAPPLLFLITSTAHYKLAQLLALGIGAAGGALGLWRFLRAYGTVCEVEGLKAHPGVLVTYLVVFAAVGGQLAWVLRPFIGDPGQDFELFRDLGGNMFSHILGLLRG